MRGPMAKYNLRTSSRTWEDWTGIFLGIAIALAPWIVEETRNEAALANATLVGLAVMLLAEFDLVSLRRWSEVGQVLCGIWVAVSPFVFGYADAGALRFWHIAAGVLVALIGVLELRQSTE